MQNEIAAKNNPKIKFVKKLLGSSKQRTQSGLFVVEGLRLCADAIGSGFSFEQLFFTSDFADKHEKELQMLSAGAKQIFSVSSDAFCKMSDTVSPQGVLGVAKIKADRCVLTQNGRYIVLCDVADPGNLGAVARTAEALGIDGMIVCGGCDVYNPKALRASMGALLRIPVLRCQLQDLFCTLQKHNIPTFASVPDRSAMPVGQADFQNGAAMLIGNEGSGLPDAVIAQCDRKITIPMRGKAESLNAAVAASILMYEMIR